MPAWSQITWSSSYNVVGGTCVSEPVIYSFDFDLHKLQLMIPKAHVKSYSIQFGIGRVMGNGSFPLENHS